jgi:aminoglycoside phosphotransferase (APT) family kinase protein
MEENKARFAGTRVAISNEVWQFLRMGDLAEFEIRIAALCDRHFGAPLEHLKRLSGGASQESWMLVCAGQAYVLRRNPQGVRASDNALPKASEAAIITAAAKAGIAVPRVSFICDDEDAIGEAYVMDFIEGETIARKILRDAEFDAVRPNLAAQCGEMLAALHHIEVDGLPDLPFSDSAGELEKYAGFLQAAGHPHPVFELAIKWLRDNLPDARPPALVHGDFRNGNIMVSPEDGLVALLDWELTHIGDPMEDLGWPCVPSWRFGQHDLPVGGFGARDALYNTYRAAGGTIDEKATRFWEILGTLKWGIMCGTLMVSAFESGADTSVERGSIGRRASETEIDLLRMLMGED